MALIWFRGATFTRLSCFFQSILILSPLNWCTLNKKIVNGPPSLYSALMIMEVGTVISLCLSCGQDLALRSLLLPPTLTCRGNAESCLEVPCRDCPVLHHFSHNLLMVFHLSVFLCSLTMGKGFDLVVLSVIAGAPGSYTPPLSHSENILSGRGGQPSPPSWKSLFVVVQCSFAKGKCLCGSLWNSSASSGLLN